jgi:cellulose synthase/poly-beta-1,6-N-acetylglucosamine synthase-like glycosyltransferase
MAGLENIILYCTLFVSLFFEVFLLITYLEVRSELKLEEVSLEKDLDIYPAVTIMVPAFNEETTIAATVDSLLALDYPQDKLTFLLIDDGSSDKTLEVMNKYKSHPQVKVFTKENEGSKFSALNFGLQYVETELVGCLDADSFVAPYALKRIVPYFADMSVKAVTPSIQIHEPKTMLQYLQRVEYSWGIFLRRMLSHLGAMYVTPGPFSIFRTRVFKDLGGYKHAHHTEDMEIALRMQRHGYKIVNSHTAHVYTVAPASLPSLYKQRVRWAYGFINNALDYKDMYFNRKYGHIGIFILPIASLSIFTTIYSAGHLLSKFAGKVWDAVTKITTAGLSTSLHMPKLDWYFLDTSIISFIAAGAVIGSTLILFLAIRLAEGKFKFRKEIFYYLLIYMFIVPLWQTKALFNTITRKKESWR